MISLASGSHMNGESSRQASPLPLPVPSVPDTDHSKSQNITGASRFSSMMRKLVSGPRAADLDMSYITPRILAMALPSTGIDGALRNSRQQVLNYLHQYHSDRYLVFNLCHEQRYQYDRSVFSHKGAPEGAITIPIQDHGVPSLYEIADFCQQALNWLNHDPDNIIVVHCLTGKGRTGLMIACLLIASNVCNNAAEAVELFNTMRSPKDMGGLKIPSQIRFVKLFDELFVLSQKSVPLSITSLSVAKYNWSLLSIEFGPTKAVLQSVKVTPRGKETPIQVELPLLLQQRLKAQQSVISSFKDKSKVNEADELLTKAEFKEETAFATTQDALFVLKLRKSFTTVGVKFWLCAEMAQTMINHRCISDGIAAFYFNNEDLDSPSDADKSLVHDYKGGEEKAPERFYVKVVIKFNRLIN
jgi:hypothetical protein